MIFGGVCGSQDVSFSSISSLSNSILNSTRIENGKFGFLGINDSADNISDAGKILDNIPNDSTLFLYLFKKNLKSEVDDSGLETIDYYLLKRKNISDNSKWISLDKITNSKIKNGFYSYIDKTARADVEYEYAIVPVSKTEGEGKYNSNRIVNKCESLVISDKDKTYFTYLEPTLTEERNSITSTLVPLERKYPVVCKIGKSNYTSGSISGLFVKINPTTYEFDFENAYKYRKDFYDWLNNGKAKVIKFWDGRSYLVATDGKVQLENSDNNDFAITTVNYIEIGNIEDDQALSENGIISI